MTSNSLAPSRHSLAGFFVATLILGLAGSAASAQDPPPAAPDSEDPAPDEDGAEEPAPAPGQAGEVITIYSDQEIARRRGELDSVIVDYGYKPGKRRGDQTIYRPQVPWKPTVVVQEEGLITLKRSPVRWMAPGNPNNALNNLWCIPPFTPMCVRIGGQIVSTTKLDYSKGRVMDEIHDPTESWRQSIANQATWARVNDEVPEQVDATWREGAPIEIGGPELPTHAERRAALLDLWASRSDTPEGAMVARVVADFLEHEVQASPHPVTAAEQAAANAQAAGVRTLSLSGTQPAPAAAPAEPPEPAPAAPEPDAGMDTPTVDPG